MFWERRLDPWRIYPAAATSAARELRVRQRVAVCCVQDKDLRAAAQLLQDALNAPTVEQEEALWCGSSACMAHDTQEHTTAFNLPTSVVLVQLHASAGLRAALNASHCVLG